MSAFSQGLIRSRAPATVHSWGLRGEGPRGAVSGKPRTVHEAPGDAPVSQKCRRSTCYAEAAASCPGDLAKITVKAATPRVRFSVQAEQPSVGRRRHLAAKPRTGRPCCSGLMQTPFKSKPELVCHSANPRALRNDPKSPLPG